MRLLASVLMATALLAVVGCGASPADMTPLATAAPAASEPSDPLAGKVVAINGDSPQSVTALTLHQLAGQAAAGDEIVVRAKVGGRADPFLNGRAVMLVTAEADVDGCTACASCDSTLPTALVQISDAAGQPLMLSLRNREGLSAGRSVLISGRLAANDGARPILEATTIGVLP